MPRPQLSRAQKLSQFFTKPTVARHVLDMTRKVVKNQWPRMYFVECAAGNGSFTSLLPPQRTVGVEVDPQLLEAHPEFIAAPLSEGGFLSLTPSDLGIDHVPRENVLVGFNPPFSVPKHGGRSNNVALEFINHAATFADTIAMILPNTFRRPLTQAKVDPRLHLVYDVNIPQDAFTVDGNPVKITTVFQIWQAQYNQNGAPIPRPIDPMVHLVKQGQWGGDFFYVKSTDPRANVRVCNWGSHATVGRVDGPAAVREIVAQNIAKWQNRVDSGQSLKNFNPDNSHYYLVAQDPQKTCRDLEDRRYLFHELAQDRASGNNPDLTCADVVRIYISPLNTHYHMGKWLTPKE